MRLTTWVAACIVVALSGCGGGGGNTQTPGVQPRTAAAAGVPSLPKSKLAYTITKSPSGYTVTDKSTGTQTQVPATASQLLFADSAVLFDPSGLEGQVYRLYQAAFNRKPDMGGLGFQIDATQKIGLSAVADSFLASPEFRALYNNLDDAQFITQLYQNVLHRAPDAGGLAFHLHSLAVGLPRNELLVQFSESPENQSNTAGAIRNGVTYFPFGLAGFSQSDEPVRQRQSLLIRAYNADGSAASIQDFVNFTHYTINRWSAYANFGVFAMGQLPATPQLGSDIWLANVNGVDSVAIDAPLNQPFYFTALWKAPVIGTVFMRADAEGAGYLVDGDVAQTIELPYAFALSEYRQAQTQLAAQSTISPQAQSLAASAATAIAQARSAGDASSRAKAAYAALSFVMPLKERLVLDASASWLAAHGARSDFDLNYEGFGSWTDDTKLAGYNAAKDAGFTSVYTFVDWKRISPSRGVYDFESLDYMIDRARALGFKVSLDLNVSLGQMPAWTRDLGFDELKAVYYENARTAVARYGGKVSQYYTSSELELDMGTLTLEQAVELARQALNGGRAASPSTPFGYYVSASAYVYYQMNHPPGALLRSGTEILALMAASGVNHDFIGLEMQYGTTFAPIDLQRFVEVLQKTHDIVKVPIYMGETGSSSMAQDYGLAGNYYWHDGLSQQAQYEWADATLRALYALPFVRGYYWVHLDPDNYDYGSDYLSTLVGTALVTANGVTKKVQSAFKNFSVQLQTLAR